MNELQRNWDARAATNFIFGGAGSSLLVIGAVASVPRELFVFASLALIGAGLGAVWLEIGSKLRAPHVFFNPFTSWMTRESFAAAMVFILGLSFLLFQHEAFLYGAALAAAAFLWCQARMLRAAKGIPAWRVPQIVPLIVCTGLAEGAGLALCFSSASALLVIFALAVVARAIAWRRYRAAANSAALEPAGTALVWLGGAASLALALAAGFFPFLAPLAGLAALATGWWLKFELITRAALKQGFSLPHLPVRGAR